MAAHNRWHRARKTDLRRVGRSKTITLADGSERPVPTIDDYVGYLVGTGLLKDKADLLDNRENDQLINAIFLDWVINGYAGCLFAAKLARRHRAARWYPHVIRDSLDPDFGSMLQAALLAAHNEGAEAVQLIFPDVVSGQDIVDLVNRLCELDEWYWIPIVWKGEEPDETVRLVGLRWVLPSGNTVNHVLGFASLDSMPPTRAAPFTALVLRVQDARRPPPGRFDEGKITIEGGRVAVHLADMDSLLKKGEANERYWQATKDAKRVMLGSAPSTGRARVTFALPLDVANKLVAPAEVIVQTGKLPS